MVNLASFNAIFSRKIWIGIVFFMLSVAPGLWAPALSNILAVRGELWVMKYALSIGPLMAIISALVFASLADRKYEAQKMFGILSILGAVFLWLSFSCLEWGWNPWWFVFFQACNAFIAAPLWVLLTKVALVHSTNAERDFPLYRVWGTVGWIAAGILISAYHLDSSLLAGKLAAGVRLVVGMAAFMMPRTYPVLQEGKVSIADKLGLHAFYLFRDKQMRVYLLTSFFLSLPFAAFYMYAPLMMRHLAEIDQSWFANAVKYFFPRTAAQMTFGQFVEIAAMLLLSWMGARANLRWLVISAMVFGVIRFALFALAGQYELLALMWLGVSLHGLCYTFFSITGQMFIDRRVPSTMRAQAQALISLLGYAGGILGPLMVGAMHQYNVGESGKHYDFVGWIVFWWLLAAMVLFCLVYFVLGFKKTDELK